MLDYLNIYASNECKELYFFTQKEMKAYILYLFPIYYIHLHHYDQILLYR